MSSHARSRRTRLTQHGIRRGGRRRAKCTRDASGVGSVIGRRASFFHPPVLAVPARCLEPPPPPLPAGFPCRTRAHLPRHLGHRPPRPRRAHRPQSRVQPRGHGFPNRGKKALVARCFAAWRCWQSDAVFLAPLALTSVGATGGPFFSAIGAASFSVRHCSHWRRGPRLVHRRRLRFAHCHPDDPQLACARENHSAARPCVRRPPNARMNAKFKQKNATI